MPTCDIFCLFADGSIMSIALHAHTLIVHSMEFVTLFPATIQFSLDSCCAATNIDYENLQSHKHVSNAMTLWGATYVIATVVVGGYFVCCSYFRSEFNFNALCGSKTCTSATILRASKRETAYSFINCSMMTLITAFMLFFGTKITANGTKFW